ncbi:kell blood group glycoprotein homolog isoform X1 [Pangasianodon hypophthalmus]|uniref:kell blood group glycoprotein homolog isoform X1 n=1 Tax=Pangasianodon hypophthalmus TaxID=310915 RepID=UPI0023079DAE|nr:kell blood group glycoprotein homolog isoform X1 [Pangasianodon hypophthalmus]
MTRNPSVQQEFLQLSLHQVQSEESRSLVKNKWRGLLFFHFFLAACIIGTVMGLGYYFLQEHTLTTEDPLPCLSPACMRIAEHFSAAMDPFSQPCDYTLFSCEAEMSPKSRGRHRGTIVSRNVTRRDEMRRRMGRGSGMRTNRGSDTERTRDDRLPDRQTALLQAIKEILESPKRNATSAAQKAQTFYNTCMRPNTTLTESIYHAQTLIQQLGGWPVSGSWTQPELNSTLALLMSQYNTFPFFNVYVGPDHNESQNYIQIDQPDFQFPVEWNSRTNRSKFNSQSLRPFFSSCKELLALLNVSLISSTKHCALYMSLSSTLVTNTAPLSYRLSQKLLYHRITIQELQELAPSIDWLSCLQDIFHPVPVSKSDVVLLHNQPYIIYMSQTISNWRHTHEMMDSYPVHTYMIMNLLQILMPALHTRFMQTMKKFSIAIDNENEVVPHWRHCVLQTVKGFDTLISHLIKDHYAGEEAGTLISDIYDSFKTKISTLNWQNEDTQDLVLNKIKSLTPKLSTNNEFFNLLKPDEYFGEVIMSEKVYFSNYLQMLLLQQRMRSRLLSHTPQPDVLFVHPFVSGNVIIIPVGLFVLPQFHSSYPRAVNYGMLGTLIAKDLLHVLLPDILSQSKSAVLESECVWSHYLTTQKGTSSLSPSQQQEVWVQYSALQVALLSYNKSLQRHSGDTSVSGLSHINLFLASFTQASCDSELYSALMPFEPSFLVTLLCVNSLHCPKPMTCVDNRSQGHLLELC